MLPFSDAPLSAEPTNLMLAVLQGARPVITGAIPRSAVRHNSADRGCEEFALQSDIEGLLTQTGDELNAGEIYEHLADRVDGKHSIASALRGLVATGRISVTERRGINVYSRPREPGAAENVVGVPPQRCAPRPIIPVLIQRRRSGNGRAGAGEREPKAPTQTGSMFNLAVLEQAIPELCRENGFEVPSPATIAEAAAIFTSILPGCQDPIDGRRLAALWRRFHKGNKLYGNGLMGLFETLERAGRPKPRLSINASRLLKNTLTKATESGWGRATAWDHFHGCCCREGVNPPSQKAFNAHFRDTEITKPEE